MSETPHHENWPRFIDIGQHHLALVIQVAVILNEWWEGVFDTLNNFYPPIRGEGGGGLLRSLGVAASFPI